MTNAGLSLRVTARGIVFLLLSSAVGLAAILRGSNLLFAVFCAMAGILVSSAWLTRRSARALSVTLRLPDGVPVAEPLTIECRVLNRSRSLAAAALRLSVALSHEGKPWPLQPVPAHAAWVPPGGGARALLSAIAPVRGWSVAGPATVTLAFPPGLVEATVVLPAEERTLILPRRGIVPRRMIPAALARTDPLAAVAAVSAGDDEFAGIREFRVGDSPRRIHWKLSGRVPGRLLVQEFSDLRARDARILLDTRIPSAADARRVARLERSVSFAAALAEALLAEGCAVRFQAFSPEPVDLFLEAGSRRTDALGELLALLKPTRGDGVERLLPSADDNRGEAVFLLSLDDPPPAPSPGVVVVGPGDMRSMMFYA